MENAENPEVTAQPVDHFVLIGYSGGLESPLIKAANQTCGWDGQGSVYEAYLPSYWIIPPQGLTAIVQVDTIDGLTSWYNIRFTPGDFAFSLGCDRPADVSFGKPYYYFSTGALAAGESATWPIPRSNNAWDCVAVGIQKQAHGPDLYWILNRNLKRDMSVSFTQTRVNMQPPQTVSAGQVFGELLSEDYNIVAVNYIN